MAHLLPPPPALGPAPLPQPWPSAVYVCNVKAFFSSPAAAASGRVPRLTSPPRALLSHARGFPPPPRAAACCGKRHKNRRRSEQDEDRDAVRDGLTRTQRRLARTMTIAELDSKQFLPQPVYPVVPSPPLHDRRRTRQRPRFRLGCSAPQPAAANAPLLFAARIYLSSLASIQLHFIHLFAFPVPLMSSSFFRCPTLCQNSITLFSSPSLALNARRVENITISMTKRYVC